VLLALLSFTVAGVATHFATHRLFARSDTDAVSTAKPLEQVAQLPASPPPPAVSVEQGRRTALVRAIEQVAPAVVSVNMVQVQAERVIDPFARDFWELFRPRYMLKERRVNSVGSGFFFDKEGHVITNFHVVDGTGSVGSVTLPDGRTLEAKLVGADERTDVAVLRIGGDNLPYASLGESGNLMIGEWVIAIGNPFGVLMKDPQPSATVGVVSANHRRVSPDVGGGERLYQDMIQTDAAINPGNSGGPLCNANGEIVGVNTMIFSPSGGSIGLGFAIPIDRVKKVAAEIIKYNHRRDPWAGFKVEDVGSIREDFKEQLGVKATTGCIVVNILSDSPAYEAGLRPGDVIISVNGAAVLMASDIDFALWNSFIGDTMKLEVDRAGKRQMVSFAIKELAR
jgi:serine protease Do